MTTLYGIKNCDTVKKARVWLDNHDIDYQFHDFRIDGITADQVDAWLAALGWEQVVNKRSTTWKQLAESTRNGMDTKLAKANILEQPTLIKRPLLELDNDSASIHVGFKPEQYSELFS